MSLVEETINKMKAGHYDAKGIINLCRNVNAKSLSDEERERFLGEAEKYLREHHAVTAKKLLGPADRHAREALSELCAQAHEMYDLSKNRVGSHVKTGGHVIAGIAIVDTYISYKNTDGDAVVAGAYQKTPNDELKYVVYSYQGSNSDSNRTWISKSLIAGEEFANHYLNQLGKLVA